MADSAAPAASVWSLAQRRLHWWTAALVAFGFALGWVMVATPLRALLLKFVFFQLHKTLGLLVFAMAAGRLLLRATRPRPVSDAGLPPWHIRAAAIGHAALYVLLVAVPLLGYLTAASAPAGVPTLFLGVIPVPHVLAPDAAWFAALRPLHQALAIALVVLAGGHALFALWHHRHGRGTLRAMWGGDRARGTLTPAPVAERLRP